MVDLKICQNVVKVRVANFSGFVVVGKWLKLRPRTNTNHNLGQYNFFIEISCIYVTFAKKSFLIN